MAFSLVYGAVATYLYFKARKDLSVYQHGALALIAQKVDDEGVAGQLKRMEELGLIDALNDSSSGGGAP